jgi:hypothetical protein
MFVKKTLEQIKALTPEEEVKYFAEKDANDLAERNKAIETAVNVVKESIEGTVNSLKAELETAKENVAKAVKKGEDLEEVTVKQGLQIKQNVMTTQAKETLRNSIGKAIHAELGDKFKGINYANGGSFGAHFSTSITINDAMPNDPLEASKALDADPLLNTTSVIPVGTITGGVNPSIDADWLFMNSSQRASKTFGKPILKNNILNYLDIKRLVGKILYGSVLGTPTGAATFTKECALKPQVRQDLKIVKSEAGKVAETIRMSEEYMQYVWTVVDNEIMPRYEQMLVNAFCSAIFDGVVGQFSGIVANASPYTLLPGHQIFQTPNLRDVISVAVNTLDVKEWMTGIIALNPLSMVELSGSKGNDGHYDTFNNGSIQLVDGQMVYVNGGTVPIIFTNSVAAGSIFVASFDAFEVGMSSDLIMRISNSARDKDFESNIWTIIMEKFCAVLSPVESTEGILYDTINNIKTLILKP